MFRQKVLITGGAGFLGSHLVDYLLERNYQVIVFDKLEFHKPHATKKGLQYIKGNILSLSDIKNLFKKHKDIKTVFHLAAALPNKQVANNLLWKINVEGTRNIIETSVEQNIKNFIFTSSNTVYGIPEKNPVTESSPLKPVEIYGKSKVAAENELKKYRSLINVQIFRCPVISGVGRLGLQAILYEFISEGKNIYVLGNGKNKYQFVDAKDLCVAMEKASKKKEFGIYNIGADEILSISQLYAEVIKHAHTKSKISSIPKMPAMLALSVLDKLNLSPIGVYQYSMLGQSLYADTKKIKKELLWQPKKTNSEMFIENYDWFVKNRHALMVVGKSSLSDNKSIPKMGLLGILKFFS